VEDPSITLDVSILGREYRVACRESEREELLQAVQFVDRRMREIRDSGKISGTERIAVMAGLNIAHELLRSKSGNGKSAPGATFDTAGIQRRISAMQLAIDRAMAEQDKLF
jgi:cell division protein ZapA